MPNWCGNTLTFESRKSIREFLEPYVTKTKDGDYEFDFDKIIPVPDALRITAQPGTTDKELQERYKSNEEKYGFAHWYDFCVAKWGTKWTGQGDFNHDETAFVFQTAWSPPTPIIEELAKKLPDDEMLILDYIEEGDDYCGKYVAGNEGGIDECYSPISDAPRSMKDEHGWEPWDEEDDEEDEECVEKSN